MDTVTRERWKKAILALLSLIVGALLGMFAGCVVSWSPSEVKVEALWPRHKLVLEVDPNDKESTTAPSPPQR